MLEKLILYMVILQAQESKMQLTPNDYAQTSGVHSTFILLQDHLL